MIIRPVFNILLLPDITYFFKRDFFPGAAADQIEVGTDILFPFLKNEEIYAVVVLETRSKKEMIFTRSVCLRESNPSVMMTASRFVH